MLFAYNKFRIEITNVSFSHNTPRKKKENRTITKVDAMSQTSAANYSQIALHRSQSNSPILDEGVYDLSYLELNDQSIDRELLNHKENSHSKIETLILSNNLLSDIPRSIRIYHNLETLDISSNQLKKFSFDFLNQMPNLRHFIAKDNTLTDSSLPKDFGDHNKLEVVNLSSNRFTQFPYQLLNIQSAREIYLGSNQIQVLPRNFEGLTHLEILYLGGNLISHLPSEISLAKNLTLLNLSDNNLTALPSSLCKLKKLRTLCLHGNNLTTLPVELVKLNLKELSLRNNPLVNRFVKVFIFRFKSRLSFSIFIYLLVIDLPKSLFMKCHLCSNLAPDVSRQSMSQCRNLICQVI